MFVGASEICCLDVLMRSKLKKYEKAWDRYEDQIAQNEQTDTQVSAVIPDGQIKVHTWSLYNVSDTTHWKATLWHDGRLHIRTKDSKSPEGHTWKVFALEQDLRVLTRKKKKLPCAGHYINHGKQKGSNVNFYLNRKSWRSSQIRFLLIIAC